VAIIAALPAFCAVVVGTTLPRTVVLPIVTSTLTIASTLTAFVCSAVHYRYPYIFEQKKEHLENGIL